MNTQKEKILKNMSFVMKEMKEMKESLVFENVSFSYCKSSPVLKNFNMKINPYKLTTLIGESGSGKSTVMKLTLGLYEPDEGCISFNSSESATLNNIRAKTAYVPQDAMLFRGTIFENIACGNFDAAFEEVQKAAKLAGADEFIIKLDSGYYTEILDDGKSLSGGQKQRIAIARALMKKADILLFDEITSALDYKTEESILKTIREISKYKTVLMITHKPDVSEISDVIYHLK